MEYIQLTWKNWDKICDFVDKKNFIKGTYLTENNTPIDVDKAPINLNKIGLKLKINGVEKLAITNDYLIKENDTLKILNKKQFERKRKLEKINVQE